MIEFETKSDGKTYVKATKAQPSGVNITKTITLNTFYEVLGKALGKDSILFDTGFIPENLIRLSQTDSKTILYYYYPLINFEFKCYNRLSYRTYLNTQISTCPNQNCDLYTIKDLSVPNVLVKVEVGRDRGSPVVFQIDLRVPPEGLDAGISETDKYIRNPFTNIFGDGRVCWGNNSSALENVYYNFDREDLGYMVKTFRGFIYTYLDTVFNTDLMASFVEYQGPTRDFLQKYVEELQIATKDEITDSSSAFNGPLLCQIFAKKPETMREFYDSVERSRR